jgi:hypothetical protein
MPGFIQLRRRGPARLEARAQDPRGGPDWAIRVFLADRFVREHDRPHVIGHSRCAQLGRILNHRFGWIDATNTFRPVGYSYRGAPVWCGSRSPDLDHEPQLKLLTRITDPAAGEATPVQTVVWGIAGATGHVTLSMRSHRVSIPKTRDGAFLVPGPADLRAIDVAATVDYPTGATVALGGDWRQQALNFRDQLELPDDRNVVRTLPRRGGRPSIEVRTPDPNGGLAWGIAAAPAQDGSWCLSDPGRIVGQLVGRVDYDLGTFEEATYSINLGCRRAGTDPTGPLQLLTISGGTPGIEPGSDPQRGRVARRTLGGLTTYAGRARSDVRWVTIATPRDVRTLAPSRRAKAILAVYDGDFPTGQTVFTSTLRNGHTDRLALPQVSP